MVVLFLATSVGVGIYAFWQGTHQDATKQAAAKAAQSCQFQQIASEVLAVPEPFKPGSDVTKLAVSDLTTGSGNEVKQGDCITAKYYGTLAADGTVFDEDFTKPLAIQFQIGVGYVIPGWDQGLIGMKAGGIRRLVIPSELGYGAQAQSTIPANSDLVFTVKLVAIK